MHRSSMARARRLFGNVLTAIPAVLLVGSAAVKFGRVEPMTAQLAQLGFFGGRLLFIAAAEMASALLFLLPRTRAIGLLLVSAYLGGAIATHMGHGQAIFGPASTLAFFWIAAAVRNPEALSWSFGNEREQPVAAQQSLAA